MEKSIISFAPKSIHFPPSPLLRYIYIPASYNTPASIGNGYKSVSKYIVDCGIANDKKRPVVKPESPSKRIKLDDDATLLETEMMNQTGGISNLADLVKEDSASYAPFGDEDLGQNIIIYYPRNHEVYPLVVPLKDDYDPIYDILQTMKVIGEQIVPSEYSEILGTAKSGPIKMVRKAARNSDVVGFRKAVDLYNRGMIELREKGIFDKCIDRNSPAELEIIEHIMEQSYARIVSPKTNALRKYEGFSNNVYGEIKHPFVKQIIKQTNLKSDQIFLDMGSGIGNVVLQVAAQTLCNAYGIEIMATPADLGIRQSQEFLARMENYCLPCGKITLKKGDFLEDEEIHDVIKRADVIFVNNYAFDAALNQSIIAKFLDIKETCQVVSLKSFVPVDRRTTLHRINAIESIFQARELYFGQDHVSWMNEAGKYYIHTINRQKAILDSE